MTARVLRGGAWGTCPARELAAGDVIRLRSGDFVPADAQIVVGTLEIDQSALPGQSQEFEKAADAALYSGSIVRAGETTAVITATGAHLFHAHGGARPDRASKAACRGGDRTRRQMAVRDGRRTGCDRRGSLLGSAPDSDLANGIIGFSVWRDVKLLNDSNQCRASQAAHSALEAAKAGLMTLSIAEAYDFLRRQNLGVISTVSERGTPEVALVNYGVTENLELVLETLQTSRKYKNLYRNPNVAMVMGTGKECLTCQYEGVAGWPTDAALPELLDIHFAARPEALLHRGWPDLVYLHVRPTWIRISNYDLMNWNVRELDLQKFAAAADQAVALTPLPPSSE